MSPKRRGSLAFPVNNLRRYVTLISQQVAIGASLIIKHPFTPPPVPSWPLHLALFVAVVRATADYQEHIVEDISDIRHMIDTFFHYLPKLPMMHIVPYKLPIPARGHEFPGVLEPLEQSETGHRTLPGIWIADSKVWSKVMRMPIAPSAKASKDPYAAREGEKVVFYTHGGGYFICSTATHREMLWRISRATGRRIFAVDYRLAPEHPFPAALQDASHAFHHLTDPQGVGFDPKNVTAAGDSAGGGLIIALMMYQRDHGLPMPSKAFLLSDKMKTMARHPYISPLWGSLEGLPPMLIQCGEAERLRDECILFTYKAGGCFGTSNKLPVQLESSQVELDTYPGMVHVFQAFPFLPESSMALQRMLEFMQLKEADVAVAEETVGLEVAVEVRGEADARQDEGEYTMDEATMVRELEKVEVAGKLMEDLVGMSRGMEDLPASLQLREGDVRLEEVHTSAAVATAAVRA
ncbi:hypothetical protein KI688_003310 [Linnemannia hyalina]|uniref:Alpha/beta hydrolase fold-3 domain-containing protein n=1 Tax=Linnemannia hyalina TaxID=64524 RepID=A0A9P7XQH6_9FUNG|nr:hypothetical protein KI688_003310 [Linnemannia hyalina]